MRCNDKTNCTIKRKHKFKHQRRDHWKDQLRISNMNNKINIKDKMILNFPRLLIV